MHLPWDQMDVDTNVHVKWADQHILAQDLVDKLYDYSGSSIFDNCYDPRQVHFSTNDYMIDKPSQFHRHVVYSNVHKVSVDFRNKDCIGTHMVNCVKCKKEKTVQFIADSGASSTFMFDKSDFVTFTETSGSIQTADKSTELPVLGYGSVIIKHEVSINGQNREVTTKLQLVYYAPGMSY